MAAGKKKNTGRTLILLALVIIGGLGVGFLLLRGQLLPGNNTDESEAAQEAGTIVFENVVDIYVLQQPIARGQVVEERHLLKVAYPRERLIEGLFITNPADAIGKRAMYDLDAGIPLTLNTLSDSTEGSFASFEIPRGYVAVTIPIDDEKGISAVAYTLRPGDHVNVIGSMLFVDVDEEWQSQLPNVVSPVSSPATYLQEQQEEGEEYGSGAIPTYFVPLSIQVNPTSGLPYLGRTEIIDQLTTIDDAPVQAYLTPAEAQRPRLVSQTLIQDAIVLWVGEYPIEDKQAALLEEEFNEFDTQVTVEEEVPEIEKPTVITLIVSPQDAVALNYMILSDATLSLALRSAGDDERINTESVTLQFIMQQYNISLPSPLPYATEPRIENLDLYDTVPIYVTP
ncbi:MAG: hypothetical protein K8R40_12650 [Anaerolineaceae bacterium]|nr:hypothetical protein [Anaerolineaceae bacterium]